MSASALERKWELCWQAVKGPELVREYKFHAGRRWRFDFAHPESKTAIEIEGGVWTKGRHTRPGGFIADCEKYNTAAAMGWAVFRLPEPMVGIQWAQAIKSRTIGI